MKDPDWLNGETELCPVCAGDGDTQLPDGSWEMGCPFCDGYGVIPKDDGSDGDVGKHG